MNPYAAPTDHRFDSAEQPSLSGDGRLVAFAVRTDDTPLGALHIHDRTTGLTRKLVDFITDAPPTISADGRAVAFWTPQALAPEDTDAGNDLYVQDLATGTSTLVSVPPGDTSGGPSVEMQPALSADRRFVAYGVTERRIPPAVVGIGHIQLWDAATGVHQQVDVAPDGTPGNDTAGFPTISADGRFVAFTSYATNLVPRDTNGRPDVFVHDTVSGGTTLISAATDGTQGNGASGGGVAGFTPYGSAISPDGQLVAFRSEATNLLPVPTNQDVDLLVRDIAAGTTTRASVPPQGRPIDAGGSFYNVAMGGDGVLAFAAFGITEGSFQVYRRDLATGITQLTSRASDGTIGNAAFVPAISADGRVVAFTSTAVLVSGDTNGQTDLFVRGPFT